MTRLSQGQHLWVTRTSVLKPQHRAVVCVCVCVTSIPFCTEPFLCSRRGSFMCEWFIGFDWSANDLNPAKLWFIIFIFEFHHLCNYNMKWCVRVEIWTENLQKHAWHFQYWTKFYYQQSDRKNRSHELMYWISELKFAGGISCTSKPHIQIHKTDARHVHEYTLGLCSFMHAIGQKGVAIMFQTRADCISARLWAETFRCVLQIS